MPTTTRGYRQLLAWARRLGQVERFGVEGTGAFAAGLLRFLPANGQVVLEVDRPDRSLRRRRGKSDPVDAEAAARGVQSRAAQGLPKSRDGKVEMAPEPLRAQLRGLAIAVLVTRAAGFRPGALDTPVQRPSWPCGSLLAAGSCLTLRSAGSMASWTGWSPRRHRS